MAVPVVCTEAGKRVETSCTEAGKRVETSFEARKRVGPDALKTTVGPDAFARLSNQRPRECCHRWTETTRSQHVYLACMPRFADLARHALLRPRCSAEPWRARDATVVHFPSASASCGVIRGCASCGEHKSRQQSVIAFCIDCILH